MSTTPMAPTSRGERMFGHATSGGYRCLITLFVATVACMLASRSLTDRDERERGDVPGWVMITLMSAVLVAALLAIAGPALEGLFNQAIAQVSQ